MTAIRQFRYATNNLGYVLHGNRSAIVIDGGAVPDILEFIKSHKLSLSLITNTHAHSDHTIGNRRLVQKTGAHLLAFGDLRDGGEIDLDGTPILIYRTPGHSEDSVCFHTGNYLITGDTLFNGTVGNCFSGDLRSFYRSIKRIMALSPDALIYAGHDYVRDSIAYAEMLEPENENIKAFLARYSPHHVFSTLQEELQINPFLRMNAPEIVGLLKKKGLPCDTEWERWHSLMTME
jgi:hydroxyacylglutathione hydrolase